MFCSYSKAIRCNIAHCGGAIVLNKGKWDRYVQGNIRCIQSEEGHIYGFVSWKWWNNRTYKDDLRLVINMNNCIGGGVQFDLWTFNQVSNNSISWDVWAQVHIRIIIHVSNIVIRNKEMIFCALKGNIPACLSWSKRPCNIRTYQRDC